MLFADDPGGTRQPDPWPPDVTAGILLGACAAEAARQARALALLARVPPRTERLSADQVRACTPFVARPKAVADQRTRPGQRGSGMTAAWLSSPCHLSALTRSEALT